MLHRNITPDQSAAAASNRSLNEPVTAPD